MNCLPAVTWLLSMPKRVPDHFHSPRVTSSPCNIPSRGSSYKLLSIHQTSYRNVHDLEAARGLSSWTSIESARYLSASFSLPSSLVLVSLFLLERQFMHCPGKGRWSSMCVPHSACRAMARPQKPIRRSFWFWGQTQPHVYFWAYS